VIYVEHHDGPSQTESGRIDWQPGWYAICDECGWMAGPCLTEADAHAAADAHDLAMGEVTLEELERQRPSQRIDVAWQVSHGQRPDGWWFAVEVPGRPRQEHGPFPQRARDGGRQGCPHSATGGGPDRAPGGTGGALHLRPPSHRRLPGQCVRRHRLLRHR
jgi:hypothetical protein